MPGSEIYEKQVNCASQNRRTAHGKSPREGRPWVADVVQIFLHFSKTSSWFTISQMDFFLNIETQPKLELP